MKPETRETVINAKELRRTLGEVVREARRGRRYVVLYRSRPAFRIVPVEDSVEGIGATVEDDPLYRAEALGRSDAGDLADRHDEFLYGRDS